MAQRFVADSQPSVARLPYPVNSEQMLGLEAGKVISEKELRQNNHLFKANSP